jgi:hypothetical protein
MVNAVLWVVMPCGVVRRRLEETEGVDMFGLLFDPEDGGSTVLRTVGKLPDYTVPHRGRYYSS